MIPFNINARQEDCMTPFNKNASSKSLIEIETIEPNTSKTVEPNARKRFEQINNNKIEQTKIKTFDLSKTIEQNVRKS